MRHQLAAWLVPMFWAVALASVAICWLHQLAKRIAGPEESPVLGWVGLAMLAWIVYVFWNAKW